MKGLQLFNGTFCPVTNGCYGNGLLSDQKCVISNQKLEANIYDRVVKLVLFCR